MSFLRKLLLTEFRNYSKAAIDLSPGQVVLTGENGAGKTNLLEAISLLSPGRGMRRAPYGDLARGGTHDGFAIHAHVEGPQGEANIGTGTIGLSPDESGRRVRIDGIPARSGDQMLDHLRVIWLTPSMDGLFTGAAGDRRRFLDRLVLAIDPAHGQRTMDYERAMRSRNRLFADNVQDAAYFEAIETQMAETGTAIAAARVEFLRLITAMIARTSNDGPFPNALVALDGTLEAGMERAAALDTEEAYRLRLADGRSRDRTAGRTLEGPHLTDLVVRHGPKDMPAELCSTGEQKALLIGLILAQARLTGEVSGMNPVLLLDEIGAHLDAGRRAALFGILDEIGCQVFMTGTEVSLFEALSDRAQFLAVSGGTIRTM